MCKQTKLFLLAEACLIFLAALPFFFPLFALFGKSVPYGVRLGNYYEEKRDLVEKIKEIEDWTSIDKCKEEFRRGYGHDPNDEEMREILQHISSSRKYGNAIIERQRQRVEEAKRALGGMLPPD